VEMVPMTGAPLPIEAHRVRRRLHRPQANAMELSNFWNRRMGCPDCIGNFPMQEVP